MYPYELFWGIDLYTILLVGGFFLGLLYFRVMADRAKFSAGLQNLCIVCALCALIGGYGCAVLAQACYNALGSGHFEVAEDTGATFYGGLIGGVAVYLLIYFTAGRFLLPRGETTGNFWQMSGIAAGSITVGHGVGRIGCLFAGCCYGRVTDAWYGVYNAYLDAKTVPVQLFEAIFLFALCAFLTWNINRGRRNGLSLYLMLYAVWRFLIEYLRADERGATVVPFLSPSQLTAILLFAVGLAVFFAERYSAGRRGGKTHEV